jgi:2,4-dienoyl-CoA reductase-like NADH-dependent reductase (Old Yellow Enzyme family)
LGLSLQNHDLLAKRSQSSTARESDGSDVHPLLQGMKPIHLFSPLTVKSITLRNRVGVSPMCQYSSEDGLLNDWHLVHLGSRAVGGAGLIIVEATGVEARGRITPGDAGLWSDAQIEPLARINRFLKQHGSVPGIQLAHAGRKASAARPWDENGRSLGDHEGGWETIAPSPIAFGQELSRVPREMRVDDIRTVQQAFRAATERALHAGCEWLELHAAHGYLLHEFYSPLSNQRTDGYGGSFENRVRMVLETAASMREVWPDRLPFTVRLSCTDWAEGGWTIDDSVELSKRLKSLGVDLIDCSSGFNTPDYAAIPFGSGFQVPFAERIRREAGVLTAAVGYITDAMQADGIVRNGRADMVLLAREMLRNPYWALEAAREVHQKQAVAAPIQYGRAID